MLQLTMKDIHFPSFTFHVLLCS